MAFDPKVEYKKQSTISLDKRINSFDEVIIPFNEEEILEQTKRCLNCPNPTCVKGCPLSLPIPTLIKLINDGFKKEAYQMLNDITPISGICSIVCDHASQCEGNCVRNRTCQPVNIGAIHRYLAFLNEDYDITLVPSNNKKVAVIGAGPSGLSCAIELRKHGYQVTVYERESSIGGVPLYGIPSFRLSNKDLEDGYKNAYKYGIEFRFSVEADIESVIQEYDAVYLAIGVQKSKYMGIPGEELKGVYTSEEFLKDIKIKNNIDKYKDYKNVFVVGGGNVAMDVSRTALRIGLKPTIVYRRSIEEAPCRSDELEEAKVEGVNLSFLTNPVSYQGNEKLESATFIKMELGEPDESGRRSPVEIKGSEYTVPADLIVLAIGSNLEKQFVNDIELNRNTVKVNNYQTSNHKVFAGGDVVTGSNTVVHAIKAGIEASLAIDNYLK